MNAHPDEFYETLDEVGSHIGRIFSSGDQSIYAIWGGESHNVDTAEGYCMAMMAMLKGAGAWGLTVTFRTIGVDRVCPVVYAEVSGTIMASAQSDDMAGALASALLRYFRESNECSSHPLGQT